MSNIPTRVPKNAVPEVTISDKSAEDRLYEFVEEQIDKMRKYTNLGNGQPTFYELNSALANYSTINCSLITLDVMAKEEYQKAKDAFDEFMAEKYMAAREALNPISLSSTKWASSKELEYYVINNWKFEYKALRDEMNHAEKKVAFTRRLIENLDSFKFNLGTLSKNAQAEVLNLNNSGIGQQY